MQATALVNEGKRRSSDSNTDKTVNKKQRISNTDNALTAHVASKQNGSVSETSTNRISRIITQTLCENSANAQQNASTQSLGYKYVIIGAGNAAGYAAKQFVDSGKLQKGELCMIGSEPVLPYERPALSKGYMLGKAKLPGFNTCAFFKQSNKQDWYDTNGINTMLGTTVSDINLAAKVISTMDGREIKYEKCLVATGARAVRLSDFQLPGSDMEGLFYLRSHAEAEALLNQLDDAKSNEEIVIVGGGYIGSEMASAILHHGFRNITMVYPEKSIIERVIPQEIAKVYEKALTSKGVKLLNNGKMVTGFESRGKSGKADTVCLNNGQKLHADLIVVGIGARANVELFMGKVDMDMNGIKVNGMMQSSVQDLYACGDVATFPIICHGESKRLEHVRAARATAMHAARSMMGIEQKAIDFLPVFYSRFLDFGWEMAGKRTSNVLFFGLAPKVGMKFGCVWFTNDKRLCGVFLEGGSSEDKQHIAEIARKQDIIPAHLLKAEASDMLMSYVLAQ